MTCRWAGSTEELSKQTQLPLEKQGPVFPVTRRLCASQAAWWHSWGHWTPPPRVSGLSSCSKLRGRGADQVTGAGDSLAV